jgi:HlyD family secretion protein
MRTQWRRIVLIALVAIGLVASFVWAFQPRPVPADLAVLERGPLRVTVDEEGETRVRDVYVVSAPVDGRLLRIETEVGDPVRAGRTILASIQPRPPTLLDRRTRESAEARLRAADAAVVLGQAEVQRAAAELDFARIELRRAQSLVRSKHISEQALDRAELEVTTREAALAEAEARLDMHRQELARARAELIEPVITGDTGFDPSACCVEVAAPVDGTVLAVHHESEQVVQAGTPLIEIGHPSDLEIVVDLLSTDAVKVEPGAEATIEAGAGARS